MTDLAWLVAACWLRGVRWVPAEGFTRLGSDYV
jgi:hypothetical protein